MGTFLGLGLTLGRENKAEEVGRTPLEKHLRCTLKDARYIVELKTGRPKPSKTQYLSCPLVGWSVARTVIVYSPSFSRSKLALV